MVAALFNSVRAEGKGQGHHKLMFHSFVLSGLICRQLDLLLHKHDWLCFNLFIWDKAKDVTDF